MRVVQLVEHGIPGRFNSGNLPDPEPGPNDVVVRVRACGLNHLDLWLEEKGLPLPVTLPRVPGSEISGEVEAIGAAITEWRVGDRVAIQSNLFCGDCEFCLAGEESLCLNGKLLGVELDGGFAERVSVPARVLVRLPAEVDFEAAAALALAGSTAMHMLTHRCKVQQGDWVLVMGGSSGVGSAAIQIAKQLGGYVITTGSTEEKRAFALQLGADYAIDATTDDWPAEVRRITAKRGVDVVVEHVGGAVLVQAFHCLARGGTIVTCGATAGREIQLNLWPFFVKQHSLVGSYGRNRADLAATLEWAAAGKLKPVVHQTFSLDQTPEAFALLRSRTVFGKLLVKP